MHVACVIKDKIKLVNNKEIAISVQMKLQFIKVAYTYFII